MYLTAFTILYLNTVSMLLHQNELMNKFLLSYFLSQNVEH